MRCKEKRRPKTPKAQSKSGALIDVGHVSVDQVYSEVWKVHVDWVVVTQRRQNSRSSELWNQYGPLIEGGHT
jgi:hypothetical protein